MIITSYTDFRQNMRAYFEKVFTMRKPLFIARPKGQDMVLMSKADYDSMQETFYLLSSPVNAERLNKAIEEDVKGGGVARKLQD